MPTPCARDGKGPGHQRTLPTLFQGEERSTLPPTPTAVAYWSNQSPTAGATVRPSLHRPAINRQPTPPAGPTSAPGHHTGPDDGSECAPAAAPLLPTPRASDGTKGCPGQRGSHGDLTLPAAAVRMLPTPTVSDARGPGGVRGGGPALRTTITHLNDPGHGDGGKARWGDYTPAVDRWAHIMGRPAPEPTQPGRHGKPVLAPRLVEWLMGLPDGWVTASDLGLPRTVALRILGNGVVPQQAVAALRLLLCPHRWAVNP